MQVAGYTYTRIHPRPSKVWVGWLCCCPGLVWEPVWKWAHMQLGREHLAIVVSACQATVDWSKHKERISACKLLCTLKKKKEEKKRVQAGSEWLNILPKSWQVRKKSPPSHRGEWALLNCVHAYVQHLQLILCCLFLCNPLWWKGNTESLGDHKITGKNLFCFYCILIMRM